MLARLDRIPGVAETRVDASGRHFLLFVRPGADERALLDAANEALRGRAVRLDDVAADAQLAARSLGDPWFSLAEVRMLSYVEARVVAAATGDAVAARVGLSRPERDAVTEAIRLEMFAAVERVHAEGGCESTGWFYEEWPRIASAAAFRASPALPEGKRGACADALRRAHDVE